MAYMWQTNRLGVLEIEDQKGLANAGEAFVSRGVPGVGAFELFRITSLRVRTSRLSLFGRIPRVEERHTGRFEVGEVAGHDGQAMHERCCCNQRIPFGAWIGHVQACAALRDGGIDGKDPAVELRQNQLVEPYTKQQTLLWIFPLELQNAELQFEDRDRRQVKAARVHAVGPRGDAWIGFPRAYFAQFGNDVGVEEKPQERSAGRIPMSTRVGSNSMSARPGIANASAIFRCPPVMR